MEKLDKNNLAAAAEALLQNLDKLDTTDPWELIQKEVQHFTDEKGRKFTMLVVARRFDDRLEVQ